MVICYSSPGKLTEQVWHYPEMPPVTVPAALSVTKSCFSPFSTLTTTSSETGRDSLLVIFFLFFFYIRGQPEPDKFVFHLLCLLYPSQTSVLAAFSYAPLTPSSLKL